jgi:DNA-binding response OmpR family regulator
MIAAAPRILFSAGGVSGMALIVLIDGDPLQARLVIDNLKSVGHTVLWTTDGWDGLLLAHRVRPNLLIVDCGVAQWTELLTLLRAMRSLRKTPLALITLRRPPEHLLRKWSIATCINRHLDAEALVTTVQQLLHQEYAREVGGQPEAVDEGVSP